MSCTTTPDPLRDLLATVAAHPGVPVDQLDPAQYKVAVAHGWVYEYRGRVGLTGAGAWHAGMRGRGGLLPCRASGWRTLQRSSSWGEMNAMTPLEPGLECLRDGGSSADALLD